MTRSSIEEHLSYTKFHRVNNIEYMKNKFYYSIFFLEKTFLSALFLFFVTKCFSQDLDSENIFHLDKIPQEGVLLDKGWKFHVGDNFEWAKPGFDDKLWTSVNPTLDIHDSLPQIPKSGQICWFRLHLSVDSSLHSQLVMMIQQVGASEMYLNGKLIHSFGVLNRDPHKVKAFSPLNKPVSFPLSNDSEQVLAVRYALQPNVFYNIYWATEDRSRGFHVTLNTIESAINQYQQAHIYDDDDNILKIGIFLILFILYIAFYLFHRSQKVNLLFSLYAFIYVIVWSLFIYVNNLNNVEYWFIINNSILVLQVAANSIMLTAIYGLLNQQRKWIFHAILILGIASIPISIYIYSWGWMIFASVLGTLNNLDITRIAFKSIIGNKRGAWIIAAGGTAYLLFRLIFSIRLFVFSTLSLEFLTFAICSIPIAVSIYLGYDFALTYRNLQRQLMQVRTLEKEKLQQQKKEAEFEKRIADLSLSALRSQINPHFIFNCLNSIKLYATQNDINAASDYLTKFSRLIRLVLENSKNEKITFSSELEVLRLYMEMEAMRFKEKLKYNIVVEENVDADYIEIPPLLLQPYVENAIWHGLMHKEQGGNIDIKAAIRNDSLLIVTIKDDGIGRAKATELKSKTATLHKSFGMKITSERMELINLKYKTVNSVTIDDLKDETGEPAGTLVTIQIQIE